MKISESQARLIVAVIAAVVAYLLVQPDVVLSPVVKVALGAVSVGLAVLSPSSLSARMQGSTDAVDIDG